MSHENQFSLSMERLTGYEFETRFDWEDVPPLLLDEPEPLGGGRGPNASRLIGAAVANCLSASLVFCLEKSKQRVKGIRTDVEGAVQRNSKGRWRLARIDVHITVDVEADQQKRVDAIRDYLTTLDRVGREILESDESCRALIQLVRTNFGPPSGG